jgi:hypothetical protein
MSLRTAVYREWKMTTKRQLDCLLPRWATLRGARERKRDDRTLVACASSSSRWRCAPTALGVSAGQSSASKGASNERMCSDALPLAAGPEEEEVAAAAEALAGGADEGSFLRWAGISKAMGADRARQGVAKGGW